MRPMPRQCLCGKSIGRYVTGKEATIEIAGPCKALAVADTAFKEAFEAKDQLLKGFQAFFMGKDSLTVIHHEDIDDDWDTEKTHA